jgi:peptide/nickel transport system ATP-binding protein
MLKKILEVKNLKKYFDSPAGVLHAVDDVTFDISEGKTLGVVGESGCGKSTLGLVILGLCDATSGQILFKGRDITYADKRLRHELRKEMQIIFQDPFSSLNPRMTVEEIIGEPLQVYKVYKTKAEWKRRVGEIMETVGLAERLTFSYPHELDGGRRQRIGIGRALAMSPKFIVCDEPVSALDVSIQAQVLNLMMDLQEQMGLTYIFITHDLSVVKHISDDIMVMYLGCMVEKCSSKELFKKPLHPYTQGLLAAIPVPVIRKTRKRTLMSGELTNPIDPEPGCRFALRCSYATDVCHTIDPTLEEIDPGHAVACHNVREVNRL